MKLKHLIFLLAAVSGYTGGSQPVEHTYRRQFAGTIPKWQVTDIVFPAKAVSGRNPFDEVFNINCHGPSGQHMRVRGFYDGSNKYVFRFSSSEEGEWTFSTESSHPALDRLTGKLTVKAPSAGETGPLLIDSINVQRFTRGNGAPHFLLAFELDWLFALDYGNSVAIPKTEQTLNTIRDHGFNHVVMNVYAWDVGWQIADNVPAEYFYGRPSYGPFGGTNEKPDFSTLNVSLFQHLDRVILRMQELGLDAHLMIYVWNKKVTWPEMYSDEDNRYFDYVVTRYQAFPNVVWDVSKEALDYGRCDIPYIDERILRIRTNDPYKRLVTVHDYEYNSRRSDNVDFISIQSWRSGLHAVMLEARDAHPGKPVVNIEHGGYESGPYVSFQGAYTNPETCLERTYECVFAGVYGSYYWQDAAWNIVIHDPFNEQHHFSRPRFDYYKHLSHLFSTYALNDFRPVYPKITTNSRRGEDNPATNGFTLSGGDSRYLIMVPAAVERTHLTFPEPPGGMFDASWFNPFTGEYRRLGSARWTGWNEYKNPWNHFAILIIERNK